MYQVPLRPVYTIRLSYAIVRSYVSDKLNGVLRTHYYISELIESSYCAFLATLHTPG